MTDNKKIYKQPAYRILNTRSKISLICDSVPAGGDDPDPAGHARHNDMDDIDDMDDY